MPNGPITISLPGPDIEIRFYQAKGPHGFNVLYVN